MSGLLAVTCNLGQTIGVAILGTVWIVRSAVRQGAANVQPVTTPIHNEVLALHDVMLLVAVILAVILAITCWAWLVKGNRAR